VTGRRAVVAAMLVAAAAASTSSGATGTTDPVSAPEQPIVPLFDCYSTNSAWGFTLSGKVIDAGGAIYSYGRHGKSWLTTPVKEQGAAYYAEGELQEKFSDARRVGSVDAGALADKPALIEAAASGKLSIADSGARDAGYSGCHAYVHDAARRRYRDVDLGSDGGVSDSRTTNDAAAAQQLLRWLQSIGVAR
jgi:hypothetical protein